MQHHRRAEIDPCQHDLRCDSGLSGLGLRAQENCCGVGQHDNDTSLALHCSIVGDEQRIANFADVDSGLFFRSGTFAEPIGDHRSPAIGIL